MVKMISKRGLRYREPFMSTARWRAAQISRLYYATTLSDRSCAHRHLGNATHESLEVIRDDIARRLVDGQTLLDHL